MELRPDRLPAVDRRARKLLRAHAAKYGFEKDKLGVLGFSAGGHLAAVATLWKSEDKNENPTFSALSHGATDLDAENRKWLEESLYHRKMTDEEISNYS